MPNPLLGYQVRRTPVVVWDVGEDDAFGQPSVLDTPEEILVRWEEIDREVLDPRGRKVAVDVQLTLNRDILPGSVVWLGRISTLSEDGSSYVDEDGFNYVDEFGGTYIVTGLDVPPSDVRRVVTFEKTPDLKGRSYSRSATLARLKNSLPTLET